MEGFRGNQLLALAAVIAVLLLAFNKRKGARYAVLITLAVLIVCGCSCCHH
jgi:uncharacterized membrane protein YhaH (DUF805 family)